MRSPTRSCTRWTCSQRSPFLKGKEEKSNRDGFVVYVGNDMFGVKWRNWKMMFKEVERGTDDKKTYDFPRFFNLR